MLAADTKGLTTASELYGVKRPLTISKRGKKGLRGVLACAEAQRGEERGKKDYRKERTIESFTFVSPNSPVVRICKIYYGLQKILKP